MSFDVIDEFDRVTPYEDICLSVREIIDGHRRNIVEGEDAWRQIATRKKYTNLTSCTAVRTALAVKEPFPSRSVSEDSHTWMRYGAYPGKFVFIPEIKNHYRICSGVASRSRSNNEDFYDQMSAVDQEGFEEAMKLAKHFGKVAPEEENDIRTAFFVRLALSQLYGDADEGAKKLLHSAVALSPDTARKAIEALFAGGNRSFSAFPLRGVYRAVPDSVTQVLVSVSKRHFKHAVDRNRTKRQIREAWRLNRDILLESADPHLHLAFIWLADELQSSDLIHRKMKNLLHRVAEEVNGLTD